MLLNILERRTHNDEKSMKIKQNSTTNVMRVKHIEIT